MLNEEKEVTARYIEDLRKLSGFREEVRVSTEFKPVGGYIPISDRAAQASKASYDRMKKKKEVGPAQDEA